MSIAATFESQLEAIRVTSEPPYSRKSAFGQSRDERFCDGTDGRVKSVRKQLSKQSRLNGRRSLRRLLGLADHDEFDVTPVRADAHCAADLASRERPDRKVIEKLSCTEAARYMRDRRAPKRRKHESETAYGSRLAAEATRAQRVTVRPL